MKKFPLIIGHRGIATKPENTIAGFQEAIKSGADAIEMDIRHTSDRKLIVFHDPHLKQLTGANGFVKDRSLKSIKNLSVSGEPIPTLDEVLKEVRGQAKLMLELKAGSIHKKTIKLLAKHEVLQDCMIFSFVHPLSYLIKRINPKIKTGIAMACLPMDAVGMAKAAKADAIVSYFATLVGRHRIQKKLVRSAHRNNIEVHTAPVYSNEFIPKEEIMSLLKLKVDAISVNRPDRLKQLFEDLQTRKGRIAAMLSKVKGKAYI